MSRILFCVVLLWAIPLQAQVRDTLEYARETAYQNNFTEADRILTLYNRETGDVYGLWLQAQVAWWMGDIDRSLGLYEKGIAIAPELSDLKFDYARTLFNAGKIQQARPLLTQYLKTAPENSEAQTLMAYLDYWDGKTARAKKTAGDVLAKDPENESARRLLQEISQATAPYLAIASSFASDDQPLESGSYAFTGGKYFSRFFSPVLKAGLTDFTLPDAAVQSYFLEAGNRFKFGMAGPEISILGGIFRPDSNEDHTEYTFNVVGSQKLSKHFSLEVKAARLPYQYTLASIRDPLMHNIYTAGLSLDDPESIVGKAAYERQVFPDQNSIHTGYAYLLKSIINSKAFRFDLGYSFNYSHSARNTFRAVETPSLQPGMVLPKFPVSTILISRPVIKWLMLRWLR